MFIRSSRTLGMRFQPALARQSGLGHALGGGYGLLARSHGLTCDNLQQITMIDAQASTLEATATSEPDLFWACRGGGGGSFGIATQFVLRIFPLSDVLVFGVSWLLSQPKAARVFSAWQNWAPNAPGPSPPL